MNRLPIACFALIFLNAAVAEPVRQAESWQSGKDIAARADHSDIGFGSSEVSVRMIIADRKGRQRERELDLLTLERENQQQGDRTLIIFRRPYDIARTALLSHAQLLEDDAQWLFLPRLGRVKRLSGASKSGSFVGTEFSFEDLTAQELDKYDYRWLREEVLLAEPCDVVERRPLYSGSSYQSQQVWFARSNGQAIRIDSFARNGTVRKRLHLTGYRRYGKFWRPQRMQIENLTTGKSTTLEFDTYQFGLSYTKQDFERSVLDEM